MPYAHTIIISQSETQFDGTVTPVKVFGKAVNKRACLVKHMAMCCKICCDREAFRFHVCAILKGKDGLKRLRSISRRRTFIEDFNPSSDKIGPQQGISDRGEPVRRRQAITVQKDQLRRGRHGNTMVSGMRGALLRLITKGQTGIVAAQPGGILGRVVVDDDNLDILGYLRHQRLQAKTQPPGVVVMWDDHCCLDQLSIPLQPVVTLRPDFIPQCHALGMILSPQCRKRVGGSNA